MNDVPMAIGIIVCIATIILLFMFVVSNIMDWLMTFKEKTVVRDRKPEDKSLQYRARPSNHEIEEKLKSVILSIDNLPESAKMITSLDEDFVAKVNAAKEVLSRTGWVGNPTKTNRISVKR